MAGSQRIRFRDLRAIYELLGEVRQIGNDPKAWRSHMLSEGSRLIHADVAMTMDMCNAAMHSASELIAPITTGWQSPAEEARYYSYFADYKMVDDPGAHAVYAAHQRSWRASARRQEMVDDRTWYGSPIVSGVRREGGVDDFVFSSAFLGPGVLHGFIFYRRWGHEPFEVHDHRLLKLLHASLLRMIFRGARQREALVKKYGLTPRLAQTLDLLISARSTKLISSEMKVTPYTLNGYVKLLYDRLRVSSRIELMHRCRLEWPDQIFLPPPVPMMQPH
jgi:DNA-binding CsgD family transcriptional regulator